MSCNFGDKIKVQIFGQSHGEMVGVVIDGIPANIALDLDEINRFLKRRQGGNAAYATPRKEEDIPHIVSGMVEGKTCGAPLCAVFENKNTKSADYKEIAKIPRPGHADLVAHIKYEGANDVRGGGHFSARLTLPLCFAGAVCMQLLKAKGIEIKSHIASIGEVCDLAYDPLTAKETYPEGAFPTNSAEAGEKMIAHIMDIHSSGDSIGGCIECAVIGMPIGIGEPMFDGIENTIARTVFAVPAVKGIEFGAGFDVIKMRGSENNDPYRYEGENIITTSNNAGGILGGISNSAPIIFRAAMKPTPSIGKEQDSINLASKENDTLSVKGRHDPCIVPRAVPCIEAAAAIAIANLMD